MNCSTNNCSPIGEFGGQNRLLASAYEARIVEINADLLNQVEIEQMCGQMVVVRVSPEASDIVKAGDTILEVNGSQLLKESQLYSHSGEVQLKLILSDIYTAPMVIYGTY